jgi:hypothetical protein
MHDQEEFTILKRLLYDHQINFRMRMNIGSKWKCEGFEKERIEEEMYELARMENGSVVLI